MLALCLSSDQSICTPAAPAVMQKAAAVYLRLCEGLHIVNAWVPSVESACAVILLTGTLLKACSTSQRKSLCSVVQSCCALLC